MASALNVATARRHYDLRVLKAGRRPARAGYVRYAPLATSQGHFVTSEDDIRRQQGVIQIRDLVVANALLISVTATGKDR